jgi:hypothetical protein
VPLEITVTSPSGRRVERVTLEPPGGSWSFATGGPARAEVNSDRGLLATLVKG